MPNPIMVPADPSANLAKGFANIADLFAPPTARDTYYGAETQNAQAKTAAERAKAARQADVYARGTAPGATMQALDLPAIAAGLYSPNQSTYAVDTKDTTERRGQDIKSGDNRYDVNSRDTTSRANNTDNNNRAIVDAIMAPQPEGSSRVLPPDVAAKYGVPAQSNGIVKLQPGQTATLPPGPAGAGSPADAGTPAPVVLQGNPKPLTAEEAKGQAIAGLSPEESHALARGEIKHAPVYGTAGGTAQLDPVTGKLVNTQSKEVVPPGTAATNLGAPTTTVNVDQNGNTYGAPEKGFAYVRDENNKIKLGANGAPMVAPMQGSAEFDKQATGTAADAASAAHKTAQSRIVADTVDQAIAKIEADPTLTTGLGSQLTSGIGGSPGYDVQALLKTIEANSSLEAIQNARDASKTGAGFGRVTNMEMTALAAAKGNLAAAQGPTQLLSALRKYKDAANDVIHGGPTSNKPLAGPARSYEKTAVNPQTNERLIYRGDQWVPE